MGLWSKKSIAVLQAEAAAEGTELTLKRALGALNLTMLGIGAIIGAGIFVLTGTAAAQYAGPGDRAVVRPRRIRLPVRRLCYAEFAAMIPIAGSAYTYGYATLGEFVAWIIGWDLILEYLFGAATVAVGWSGYFVAFLQRAGLHIPPRGRRRRSTWSARTPRAQRALHRSGDERGDRGVERRVRGRPDADAGVINLPAMILIGLMTTLLVIGIKESARFNNVIVFVKVAIVLLVIGFGFMYVNTGELASVHSAQHRRVRPLSAGAASCAARRSSSSPTSASTPCRPRRRKRRIRSATCRSAFSARSPSARCSTS